MKTLDGSKLPFFLQTLYIIAQPIKFLEACARRYGETFSLRLLGFNSPPVVFFSRPEAIGSILNAEADKFEFGKATYVFQPLVGTRSLIMLDGEQHQAMRHLLLPPLHGKKIYGYGQTIIEITTEAIANWRVGSSVLIRDCMCDISLEVILKVVFGLRSGERYHRLKKLIIPFLEGVNSPINSLQFFFAPLQQNWGKWSPWGKFVRQRQAIDDLIYAEIASRRNRTEGKDVLSLLMSARDEEGNSMSDEQLRDQLITLLLLGHETTASALSWAFYWVDRQPSLQEKLQQELDSLGKDADVMAISQLPLLNAVCQEALRIYPIALIAQPRIVKETVKIDGYEFEPGSVLVPCIYLAHKRKEAYPEPDKFMPERFLDRKFSSYEYLPFGGGNRNCIGMALSLFEMKLVLATVLSQYNLKLTDKDSVKPERRGITIVPSGGCQMEIISKRNVRDRIVSPSAAITRS
jgi:cytochrome P450